MSNSSILPIDRTISGATTPGQSGPESDGIIRDTRIPQSSSITGASPSNCLYYLGHSLEGFTPLKRFNRYILQSQPTGWFCKEYSLRIVIPAYRAKLSIWENSEQFFCIVLPRITYQRRKEHPTEVLNFVRCQIDNGL